METQIFCPICRNDQFEKYPDRSCTSESQPSRDIIHYNCSICGQYKIGHVTAHLLQNELEINKVKRAAVSHMFKLNTIEGKENTLYHQHELTTFFENVELPNPWLQSIAIIRFVGKAYMKNGEPLIELPTDIHSIVGSPNRDSVFQLIEQLIEKKLLKCTQKLQHGSEYRDHMNCYLTVDGWELYEEDSKGKISSNYGFIALKFGDDVLDRLIKNTIKLVGKDIGYEIYELREFQQAGIIDNIMRSTIRNAAFLLADLTHDNLGAYWEAGYAEGLGKPVIYICRKDKFDDDSTHFDTNHCTTVIWHNEEEWEDGVDEKFKQDITATLSRSLNL